MAIGGKENTLADSIETEIKNQIRNAEGEVKTPNSIPELAQGIADALIPFLTNNGEVDSGITIDGIAKDLDANSDWDVDGSTTETGVFI